MTNYKIIPYDEQYQQSWVRCRVLAFLDSVYYDDVHLKKEKYDNPEISLIAICNDEVVGFFDVECEVEPGTICSKNNKIEKHLAGMIWHVGIHPDYRKRGIAKTLLEAATQLAKEKNLKRLEAWTRDDAFVNDWYTKNDFVKMQEYVHWYYNNEFDDIELLMKILNIKKRPSEHIQTMFGQAKTMTTEISKLNRKYFCKRFDKLL